MLTATFASDLGQGHPSASSSIRASSSVPPTLGPSEATTLAELLSGAVARWPNQNISFDNDVDTLTHRRLGEWAANLAHTLLDGRTNGRQLKGGDIAVLYFSNHRESMVVFWACVLAGIIPCLQPTLPADPTYREGHLAHLDATLDQPAYLTDHAHCSRFQQQSGREVIALDEAIQSARAKSYTGPPQQKSRTTDIAALFLTSGSTGFSKAVVHTHQTILAACRAKIQAYQLGSLECTLNWVGFDHVAGSIEMHLTSMMAGARQVHASASSVLSSAKGFIDMLAKHSVAITFAPNFFLCLLLRELREQSPSSWNLSKLRRINSGGEAVGTQTAKELCQVLHRIGHMQSPVDIAAGFGMTETCAGCIYQTVSSEWPEHPFLPLGSCVPGCSMRIVDSDGTVAEEGQEGELQVRGSMLFKGYYNNAVATSTAFDGDWFRTGDCGVIEEGVLRLSGRIKDTLLINGVSYSIAPLETQLGQLEGIAPETQVVAPYRIAGAASETFLVFFGVQDVGTFEDIDEATLGRIAAVNDAIRRKCLSVVAQAPHVIVPMALNRLQRSTLGKLSRAALVKDFDRGAVNDCLEVAERAARGASQASFVAPANETEATIAAAYASIFEKDTQQMTISAEQDFFGMGGTSLEVLKLKAYVQAAFSCEVPIIVLMTHATPRSLAGYIDAGRNSPGGTYDPVVPLNRTGDGNPIFFVHPGVGEVLIFVNLAKYFQGERPFYALRARGFEGQPFFTSMEEMVDEYHRAVLRTQPTGPYAIAGYSYGGVVAYEVARRLEAGGHRVNFTGLINIPPEIASRMHEITWTSGMLNLSYFLGLVSKADAAHLEPELAALDQREQIRDVFARAPSARIEELQLTPEKLQHWVAIAGSLIECGKGYKPAGAVSSALEVFYAIPLRGSKEDWLEKQLKPWGQHAREGRITFTDVPGEHYTLMDIDHVARFQQIFRQRLRAAEVFDDDEMSE